MGRGFENQLAIFRDTQMFFEDGGNKCRKIPIPCLGGKFKSFAVLISVQILLFRRFQEGIHLLGVLEVVGHKGKLLLLFPVVVQMPEDHGDEGVIIPVTGYICPYRGDAQLVRNAGGIVGQGLG